MSRSLNSLGFLRRKNYPFFSTPTVLGMPSLSGVYISIYYLLLKSVDSNCFALLELISTAQRTEAQLFAMNYVSVKQSIFINSCKPRQECSKWSKSSERCTRRAARVRAKVRVLNLTTLLTLGRYYLLYIYIYLHIHH